MIQGIAIHPTAIRVRTKLGKYRIERKLGEGGFASVYEAMDTIEGIRVALKIPYDRLVTPEVLEDFRREVRIAARLIHPHILPLKNAEFIDGHFVIAFPLGEKTLADRLQNRLALPTSLDYACQMLEAVAYAHEQRIIHCDIKPENLILFPDNRLQLTDFGIAKVALRTIRASGSGTVGYVAPEQAMGKPSFRSDVFSVGLILYRMLAGRLPEWPYEWPPPGFARARHRLHPELIDVVRKAIAFNPRDRYADGSRMLAAVQRVRNKSLRYRNGNGAERGRRTGKGQKDWRTVRRRQFQKQFGGDLETVYRCGKCEGPVSEAMKVCPWCGDSRRVFPDVTRFPQCCPRCNRGLKLDWHYCPWCYGGGFEVESSREYPDQRYVARCQDDRCTRRLLMPFMSYCPWCRRKVRRSWKVPGSSQTCSGCGWGIVDAYWSFCPWCGKPTQT